MTFYKNNGGKYTYFFAKKSSELNICLFCIPLNFSTWMDLDSDLNAGRWVVQGQLYGKISEEARKGPK